MGLESATHLNDLNTSNPAAGDFKYEGDDHLRLIKSVLKTTFPYFGTRAFKVNGALSGAQTPTYSTSNMNIYAFTGNGTLNLPAAADAGNGYVFGVHVVDGISVVVDPNSTELVNGAGTLTLTNCFALLFCTGTAWHAMVSSLKAEYGQEHGRCRLDLSGGSLTLNAHNGASLVIDGVVRRFSPSAPPTLSAAALSVGTTYYIYAYWTGSAVALVASTTGHAKHTDGVEIESGNSARTLVGMARTVTGPAWQDTNAQRFVLSWFNRKRISGFRSLTSGAVGTNSAPWIELTTNLRVEFLTWGENVALGAHVTFSHDTGGGSSVFTGLGVDASLVGGYSVIQVATGNINLWHLTTERYTAAPAEGYHYASLMVGLTGTGATTYEGLAGYTSVTVELDG